MSKVKIFCDKHSTPMLVFEYDEAEDSDTNSQMCAEAVHIDEHHSDEVTDKDSIIEFMNRYYFDEYEVI